MTTSPDDSDVEFDGRTPPALDVVVHYNVPRIAKLARLALTDAETVLIGRQLADVFTLVKTMLDVETIDSDGNEVEPLTTPLAALAAFPLRLRDDAVTDGERRADFQRMSPSVEDGLFLVPKVIE